MSALNPIIAKLATSKIEVVGGSSEAPEAKDLEALFLERGFIAMLGIMQHGTEPSCGGCSACSACLSPFCCSCGCVCCL